MKKICPKCGVEFDCKHSADCWCVDVNINKELSEYLQKNYENCLCRECLNEFISKGVNNFVQ